MESSQNITFCSIIKKTGVLFKRSELNRANSIGNDVFCILQWNLFLFRKIWMILFHSFRCGLLRIHYPCRWIQQFHTITENFALSLARTPLCLHCVTNIQRVNRIRWMCSKSIKLHRARTLYTHTHAQTHTRHGMVMTVRAAFHVGNTQTKHKHSHSHLFSTRSLSQWKVAVGQKFIKEIINGQHSKPSTIENRILKILQFA